jgi:hypothetical protein
VVHGLSEDYTERRRQDHKSFYCPNGHSLSYSQESREEKLKRQLDQTARSLSWTQSRLETTKRQKAAAKGQLTKTKRRIANGVCPCCNRTFADLAAHMHGQHPEYGGEV